MSRLLFSAPPSTTSAELLRTILAISPTGTALLRPLYRPDGTTIKDFAYEYLNPAAQCVLGLAAHPTCTYLEHDSLTPHLGTFSFLCTTFQAGKVGHRKPNHARTPNDHNQPLVAQRSGDLLVVSFADEATQTAPASFREPADEQCHPLGATDQLIVQRETFYQIFEQTPAAICMLRGPEHRLDYFNPAYQQLFPERLQHQRTIAELQPEAVEHGFVALLDHVYQTGETYLGYEHPLAITQANGQPPRTMYFDFTYQAFQEQGLTVGISVFAYDVTERVRTRQAADQQRKLLHALFMDAPAAICIMKGPDLVYELVNPGYQALFPERELLGKTILQALPEIANHAVYHSLQQVFQTGITHQKSSFLIPLVSAADGALENRYFTYIQQAHFDEQDQLDGVVVFAFEVTPQVRARQTSEAAARQLRLLTDSLPVLIAYVDRALTYQFTNQAHETWFGQHPDDLRGQPVHAVLGEMGFQKIHSYMNRALAGERVDFETKMVYQHGAVRDTHTTYVPDRQHGQVLGFYSLISDITEQVQAREQVQQLNKKLQASNEELQNSNQQLMRTNVDLDSFIYTASHDLKAPITNIEGLVQALRDQVAPQDKLGQTVAPFLDMMQQSVTRFQCTLAHLSDITRLQKEHNQPAGPADLGAVIEDVRLDLQALLEQTGAQLEIDLRTGTIPFLAKNLRSILYNLLSNALKYRAPDRAPHIRLRCYHEEPYTVLAVQDNGLGLSPSQQTELFQMFRRLHTHVEGSGIGLYMVKRMVENAGGKITVASDAGVGSTFFVHLRRRTW